MCSLILSFVFRTLMFMTDSSVGVVVVCGRSSSRWAEKGVWPLMRDASGSESRREGIENPFDALFFLFSIFLHPFVLYLLWVFWLKGWGRFRTRFGRVGSVMLIVKRFYAKVKEWCRRFGYGAAIVQLNVMVGDLKGWCMFNEGGCNGVKFCYPSGLKVFCWRERWRSVMELCLFCYGNENCYRSSWSSC